LVHAGVEKARLTWDVRGALLGTPGRVRGRDVVHVRHVVLVGAGHIDVGGVGAHVGGRFGHLRLRIRGKGDDVLLEDEGAQSVPLRARGGTRPADGLVGVHLRDTGGEGAIRQVRGTGEPWSRGGGFGGPTADLERRLA